MNIDKIEITENNCYIEIYPHENKVIVKNRIFEISDEEIRGFIRIIRTWKSECGNLSYMDGNIYDIKIYANGEIDEKRGLRDFPENYEEFTKFVRRIYESE